LAQQRLKKAHLEVSMTRRPRARARGKVWSFRRDRTPVELRASGYAAQKHRNASNVYQGMPAFIAMKIEIAPSVEWILDLDPEDARKFHKELGEAIADAQGIEFCAPTCNLCSSGDKPHDG
jgi:hypothetical protein